jgi:hypothetical protein
MNGAEDQSMNIEKPVSYPELPIMPLASMTFLAGVGGLALSFLFLASNSELDVIAGGVGFVTGAILAAAGLVSLALQTRSPEASELAMRGLRCFYGFLPSAVAVLGWPILFFGFFPAILLMPGFLIGCAIWAWWGSRSVAENLIATHWQIWIRLAHAIVFVIQLSAIAASWPLFRLMLDTLKAMGFIVGWP